MIFAELIEDYIKHCTNCLGFAERSINRYRYLLDVYREYIEDKCKINDSALEPYFNGIDVKNILNAAEYYLDTRKVNSQDTVDMFVSVVKEFHRYIRNQFTLTSERFFASIGLSDNDEKSFTYQYLELCVRLKKEKRIKYSSQGKVYSQAEIDEITSYCDENLDSNFNINKKQEDCYNRYVRALVTKLIIYTGVSVATKIFPIKVVDINLDKGTIKIGEFEVHLPYHLRNNLNEYVSKFIGTRDKTDLLFKTYDNMPIKQPNYIGGFYVHRISGDIRGKSSTIALSKYSIIQMVEAGIDRDTIQAFTGYGDSVYISCKEYVDMEIYSKRAKKIDETLKTLPSFDFL